MQIKVFCTISKNLSHLQHRYLYSKMASGKIKSVSVETHLTLSLKPIKNSIGLRNIIGIKNFLQRIHVLNVLELLVQLKLHACHKFSSIPEMVLWCSKHFNAPKIVIFVNESTMPPTRLSPIVFHKMLRLLKLNKELKLPKEDAFIKNNDDPKTFLSYFTNSLNGVKTNVYQYDISFLKETFREFAWSFTWVTDQESTTYFPQYTLFYLSTTFRMYWNFYQAQIISNEISHQLSNYQQIENFFMITYLIYVVVYNCILKELLVERDIDISQDHIQFRYPMLWKHKSPFHIYQIHDSFLGRCKGILTGELLDKVTQEAKDSLEGKYFLFIEEKHVYLKLYVFKGTPFLIPKFVTYGLFISVLCRQYLYGSSSFEQKHKR